MTPLCGRRYGHRLHRADRTASTDRWTQTLGPTATRNRSGPWMRSGMHRASTLAVATTRTATPGSGHRVPDRPVCFRTVAFRGRSGLRRPRRVVDRTEPLAGLRPSPPQRRAMISAAMLTAVSSAVRAPRSSFESGSTTAQLGWRSVVGRRIRRSMRAFGGPVFGDWAAVVTERRSPLWPPCRKSRDGAASYSGAASAEISLCPEALTAARAFSCS